MNVVHRDLHLYFQGHPISENRITLYDGKTVKANEYGQVRLL